MTNRDYEIAALVYGLLALALLTVAAISIGDRVAVLLMVGSVCAAYLCQTAGALYLRHDVIWLARSSYISWIASVAFSVAAIVRMVLA